MKIIVYGVKKHEEESIRNWADSRQVEISTTADPLTEETAGRARGFDGLCIQQLTPLGGASVYRQLKALGLRQIATRSAGFDVIDLAEAKKNGLTVTHVPAYSPYAVAELAVTQALQLIRHIPQFYKRLSHHDFRLDGLISRELRSMTVGIIGTGRIGATAAQLFKAFGARVIAFDRYPNDCLSGLLDYKPTLEAILEEADLVSLHTPLLESTRHMMNKKTFRLMKKSAFLVNIARGGLVDTGDLIEALETRQIAGAALDVFEDESFLNKDMSDRPLGDPHIQKLLNMDQVLLTPHVGFFTTTAVENIVNGALDSVLDVLTTGKSANEVRMP